VERRIYGIETEFGITCVSGGQRTLTPDEVARYLFRRVVSWGRSSNVFLTNGSRLYLDVGSHPEYATAECDDLVSLVAHDKAGERILHDLVGDAQERLAEDSIAGEIYVFKNNTDSAGNSYGCHENYLIGRGGEFQDFSQVLIPFLVTRQLICGAGKVISTTKGARYCLSQRADHIWEGVSSATTRSRPIINTRDEPHADAEHYRRLHVIVGDSNMSETTTLLKVGSCALVLRMIEEGAPLRDVTLDNAIRAIRDVSQDGTATASPSGMRSSRRSRTANRGRVARHVDWIAKHALLRRQAERHGLAWDDPRMLQLDMLYHDIDPARGLALRLEAAGALHRWTSPDAVAHAVRRPPATTRAALRGAFVAAAQEHRREYTVDWTHLRLDGNEGRTAICKDPFATTRRPGSTPCWS
jgi:proteasome accessory factor A